MNGPDMDGFFHREGIEVFAEVGIADIPAPDRDYVSEFLPGAGSVIIFAREIPAPVYRMPPKEKTGEMLKIAEALDKTAVSLSGLLKESGIPARPVPLYLPVTITDGRVRGLVRLKKIAAAGGLGEIGKSSLLLTPQYGPRVFISGVVTGHAVPGTQNGDAEKETVVPAPPLCTGCGLCVKHCPGNAFGPDGVDAFRCLTIRPWVPPVVVPLAKWLLGRPMLLRCVAPLAPYIARVATMPCSECVTGCPRF
ncbi:4Fe-4S binding protein [Methanogenium cariaci]|jgi:epoxyqueuosine reductase QueG